MSKDDNKTVQCVQYTEEGPVAHWVDRTLCLLEARAWCSSCPHSRFVVRFQLRVSDQLAACPRWSSEEDRKQQKDPVVYETVQRDTCINEKPFLFCQDCPNSNPANPPRTEVRWIESEARARRIEQALDEEERDER